MMKNAIAVLGIFAADLTFRAKRLPVMGETLLGNGFAMGPGGKGSNQSIAAARAGGHVRLITKIGQDAFGDSAVKTWGADGVDTSYVVRSANEPTATAFIFVSSETGDNAIIVNAGAAGTITADDVNAAEGAITSAHVFITQLETSVEAGRRGLELARKAGAIAILNPAPSAKIDPEIYKLCDYVTPNETEAGDITGVDVRSLDDARAAGDRLLQMGVGTALITLGANGVLLHSAKASLHVPAFKVKVVETTGAGDAFNGGFAVALAEGRSPEEAARFGVALAALSVGKPGAAASMPSRGEIDKMLSSK